MATGAIQAIAQGAAQGLQSAAASPALSEAAQGLTAGMGIQVPETAQAASSAPFAGVFQEAAGQIDALEAQARSAVVGLMDGSGVDVHQAMIATQKASMAFELSLAIRNKAVQAYQQVMNLQF